MVFAIQNGPIQPVNFPINQSIDMNNGEQEPRSYFLTKPWLVWEVWEMISTKSGFGEA